MDKETFDGDMPRGGKRRRLSELGQGMAPVRLADRLPAALFQYKVVKKEDGKVVKKSGQFLSQDRADFEMERNISLMGLEEFEFSLEECPETILVNPYLVAAKIFRYLLFTLFTKAKFDECKGCEDGMGNQEGHSCLLTDGDGDLLISISEEISSRRLLRSSRRMAEYFGVQENYVTPLVIEELFKETLPTSDELMVEKFPEEFNDLKQRII